MQKNMQKLVFSLSFIVCLGLFNNVQAGYVDSDSSIGDEILASSLDMEIVDSIPFNKTGLMPNENVVFTKKVENVGDLDFQYKIESIVNSGSDVCESLNLEVTNNSYSYSGLLKDFVSSDVFVLNKSENDDWTFEISLPVGASNSLEMSECKFDINFVAWQKDIVDPVSGWIERESLKDNLIETGDWLDAPLLISPANNSIVNGKTLTNDWSDVVGAKIRYIYESYRDENATILRFYAEYSDSEKTAKDVKNATFWWRVRAYDDLNSNGKYDVDEPMSNWSDLWKVTVNNTTSLIISSIDSKNVSVTESEENKNGVEISWVTNELATSNVVYDVVSHVTVSDYVKSSLIDLTADNTDHKVVLTDITDKQIYYYRVISKNVSDAEVISDEKTFGIMGNETSNIVLNEFIPDPVGLDGAAIPNGEWVELYNLGDIDVDLNNWVIFDDTATNKTIIGKSNSDNNQDTSDAGETIIPAKGYLVVYLTGSGWVNNEKADTLNLSNGLVVVDSFSYDPEVDFPDTKKVPTGKTYARFPDGGVWVDPQPTPGEENKFEPEELKHYQEVVLNDCFKEKKLVKNEKQNLCNPVFVKYVGLIEKEDSDDLNEKLGKEILERIKKNVAKGEEDLAEEILSNDDKTEKKVEEEKKEEVKDEVKDEVKEETKEETKKEDAEEVKIIGNVESAENKLILDLKKDEVSNPENLLENLFLNKKNEDKESNDKNPVENNSNVVVEEQNNQSLSVE